MLVALIQPQIWDLNTEKNLKNLINITKDLPNCIDWVIFPEMFLTGFDFSVFKQKDYISFIKESQSTGLDFLRKLAKEKSCATEGSILLNMDKKFFNRHYFITQENEWYYDKQKLFSLSDEAKYLNKGVQSTIAEFKDWKINLKTCYDVRFPEICRNQFYTLNSKPSTLNFNYDIMTFVASWPKSRSKQWTTLLQARAIENMCYVIGVNRQGVDSSNNLYGGDSCVINCKGEFLQELNQTDITECRENEFIHYYSIDKEDLDKQRQKFPVYLDWQDEI